MNRINQLMDLSGRKALITGGAGHVGLAVGQTLMELGAQVAILDRDEKACRQRVDEIENNRPGSALACPCNLSEEKAIRKTVRDLLAQLGGLEIFVHCAALVGTN